MKITNNIIKEIKQNIHSTVKDKKKLQKLIDSYFPGGKAYGARNPEVRKIAKKYLKELKKDKKILLKVSKELWKDGHIEPRIIASIFIGSIIYEKESIVLIKKWVPTLDNWANADLLMGETKRYWIEHSKETLVYSKKLIKSKNPWDRRFGLIILIFPIRRHKITKKQATDIANRLKDDREKYVRKGYIWLMDQISKS
ncbi:MAG: DNA alkylation repair protein [Nanoarchaeota archaeon]|nr:DNA alkylation repair protein [Nanoarchaeota archaeon]MBU4124037.1 DNA alkylation repair protein [Nanoarchaeota archaeon]